MIAHVARDQIAGDGGGFAGGIATRPIGWTQCFVDPNSTSGYLYPHAALIEAGINPETDITPVIVGGHDASVLAVASGQCDAGFAQDSTVDKTLIKSGQLKPGDLTTVWKSDVIAGFPVAVSDDLDPALHDKIAKAFQGKVNVDYLTANGFCTSVDKCTVDDAGDWGYAKVDDAFYDTVRKVCDVTSMRKADHEQLAPLVTQGNVKVCDLVRRAGGSRPAPDVVHGDRPPGLGLRHRDRGRRRPAEPLR